MRGATRGRRTLRRNSGFQSTHPMRGATWCADVINWIVEFQSTHPMRGATRPVSKNTLNQRFQSTHPMRGATFQIRNAIHRGKISIHAPHAGCDKDKRCALNAFCDFNPRTPCGVRLPSMTVGAVKSYFNPRTPCGVRPLQLRAGRADTHFNPRTPCGVRRLVHLLSLCISKFQSTHPMRGATASQSTDAAQS